jgi:WD repeat-containing protein 68
MNIKNFLFNQLKTTMTEKRKEIFTYEAPWTIYGMSWSARKDKPFRLAIGSYLEEYNNHIQIIEVNETKGEFQKVSQFSHPYPPTKIQWMPDLNSGRPDILATTGDYLRIWENGTNGVKEKYTLNSVCHYNSSFRTRIQSIVHH